MSLPAAARARFPVAQAVGFVLVALNLRIAIAALSPLLDEIQGDLHLSSPEAGLLTTLPVVCFGLFAFITPVLARRFGPHLLLGATVVVMAAGTAMRLLHGAAALYASTLVAGAAIAVANVLMPGLIKRDFARHTGLMTGLYTMSLSGGAALASGLTVPLRNGLGIGWHEALALWTVVAVVAALAWAPQVRRHELPQANDAMPPALRALLRDRVAWAVTLFMGVQSVGYYATLAWVPTLLQDHGMGSATAGWMLSYSSFFGIVSSLVTPVIERRYGHAGLLVLLCAACATTGFLGLALDPVPLAYLWMTILGLAQGASISLALGFIVARSPDIHHTGQLSTMAQGIGYLIACLGPVVVGALHSATSGWGVPLMLLVVLSVLQGAFGVRAGRDRHVLAG